MCKLHLNEPGCFVGEHIHVRLRPSVALPRFETAMDRPGEPDRSTENRTEEAGFEFVPAVYTLTRVGDMARREILGVLGAKREVDEAKAEEEQENGDDL